MISTCTAIVEIGEAIEVDSIALAALVDLEQTTFAKGGVELIDSYGEVTADKSQMGYLPQGAEVLSVNVKEGDHVEEGDVIISVKKELPL